MNDSGYRLAKSAAKINAGVLLVESLKANSEKINIINKKIM
jgi:hypothetical protein